MIKIEVTGNSIPEVADKLLAIGASLQASAAAASYAADDTAREALQAKRDTAPSKLKAVKEAAPEPVAEAAAPAATLNFETEVAPVVLMFVQKRSKEEASKILSEFGVERASMLDPTLWPELVSRLVAEMS